VARNLENTRKHMTQFSDSPGSGGVNPVPYPAGAPFEPQQRPSGQPGPQPTADVAKDQAAEVAGTARDAGKHVASVAGEQPGHVASEATQQVKQLVHQTRSELTEQAANQQQRVASGLRSLSTELSTMAQGSEQPGMAPYLVHQASSVPRRWHRGWNNASPGTSSTRSLASLGNALERSWPWRPAQGFSSAASDAA
jgi:hypothetical protein